MNIIFEVGLNHMGRESYSNKYIDKISSIDCNAVTYQVREKDFYKNKSFINSELSINHYSNLVKKMHDNNKKFGIALADENLIDDFEKIGVDFYKVLSWDLNNYKFIDKLLKTKKQIYVSTGMSSIEEIVNFCKKYDGNKYITLIHTQLSFNIEDVHLKAIPYLKELSSFPVAFLNHCENPMVMYSSISFEPSDIFVYVSGDEEKKHPDEPHSIKLNYLDEFVKNVKDLEVSIGRKTKIKMENILDKENLK